VTEHLQPRSFVMCVQIRRLQIVLFELFANKERLSSGG